MVLRQFQQTASLVLRPGRNAKESGPHARIYAKHNSTSLAVDSGAGLAGL